MCTITTQFIMPFLTVRILTPSNSILCFPDSQDATLPTQHEKIHFVFFCFSFFFVFLRGSHHVASYVCPGTHYVHQAGSKLTEIDLSLPLECRYSRPVPPSQDTFHNAVVTSEHITSDKKLTIKSLLLNVNAYNHTCES